MSNEICENPQFQSPLNRASKDKFYMVLSLPHVMRKMYKDDELLKIDPLQISVFGTVVPTVNVPTTEVRYYGQSTNVSSYSRPNYEPLTVSFVVDNNYQNYYVLWKWLAVLNDPETSIYAGTSPKDITMSERLRIGNQFEYQTNILIYGLNEYNKPTIQFKYTNCCITSLGQIIYSYRDSELIESSAQFNFNQLHIDVLSEKKPYFE